MSRYIARPLQDRAVKTVASLGLLTFVIERKAATLNARRSGSTSVVCPGPSADLKCGYRMYETPEGRFAVVSGFGGKVLRRGAPSVAHRRGGAAVPEMFVVTSVGCIDDGILKNLHQLLLGEGTLQSGLQVAFNRTDALPLPPTLMTPWSLAAAAAAALRRQVSKKPDEASEAPATAAAVSPPARRTENGSIAPAEASAQVESLATSVRVALRPSDAKAASGVVSTPVAKPPLSEATEAAWNSPQQPQQLQGPLVGKIVYASRTHGQLQHVIAELRKTSYSVPPTQGGVRVCVLGSREHLCVNASLKHLKGASLARSCKQKVKAQACAYYSGFIRNRDAISQRLFLEGGLDIEELRSLAITVARIVPLQSAFHTTRYSSALEAICLCLLVNVEAAGWMAIQQHFRSALGRRPHGWALSVAIVHATQGPELFCPYYQMRDMQSRCEVVMLPYNYLMDLEGQSALLSPETLKQALVIIDEAHNIEGRGLSAVDSTAAYRWGAMFDGGSGSGAAATATQVAENACSFTLRQVDVGRCLTALQQVAALLCDEPEPQGEADPPLPTPAAVYTLGESLQLLDKWLAQLELHPPTPQLSTPHRLLPLDAFAPAVRAVGGPLRSSGSCGARKQQIKPQLDPDGPTAIQGFLGFESREGLRQTLDRSIELLERRSPTADEGRSPLLEAASSLQLLKSAANVRDFPDFPVAAYALFAYAVLFHVGVEILFGDTTAAHEDLFRVYVHPDALHFKLSQEDETSEGHEESRMHTQSEGFVSRPLGASACVCPLSSRALTVLCLSPAPTFAALASRQVRSVLFASGTLAPLEPLAARMRSASFRIPHFFESEHFAGPQQVKGILLTSANPTRAAADCCKNHKWQMHEAEGDSGGAGHQLLAVYKDRESVEYLSALSCTLARLCRGVFGGVLVFLSSYSHLDTLYDFLCKGAGSSWFSAIKASKAVYKEPRRAADLPLVLQQFKQQIDQDTAALAQRKSTALQQSQTTGAVLLAVCKGKIAEGLDIGDSYCRCVVVCGVPYASLKDPRRVAADANLACPSGSEWYRQEAMRAVNQAAGRICRHNKDFGLVVLADARFAQNVLQRDLSAWLRASLSRPLELRAAVNVAKDFFAALPASLKDDASSRTLREAGVPLPAAAFSWDDLEETGGIPLSLQALGSFAAATRRQPSAALGAAVAGNGSTGGARAAAGCPLASQQAAQQSTTSVHEKDHADVGASIRSTNSCETAESQVAAASSRRLLVLQGSRPLKKRALFSQAKGAASASLVSLTNAVIGFGPELARDTGRQLLRSLKEELGEEFPAFCSLLKQISAVERPHHPAQQQRGPHDSSGTKRVSTLGAARQYRTIMEAMCDALLLLPPVAAASDQQWQQHEQQERWHVLLGVLQRRAEILRRIAETYIGPPFSDALGHLIGDKTDAILRQTAVPQLSEQRQQRQKQEQQAQEASLGAAAEAEEGTVLPLGDSLPAAAPASNRQDQQQEQQVQHDHRPQQPEEKHGTLGVSACRICAGAGQLLRSVICGHTACKECWGPTSATVLQCHVCGRRVLKKLLQPFAECLPPCSSSNKHESRDGPHEKSSASNSTRCRRLFSITARPVCVAALASTCFKQKVASLKLRVCDFYRSSMYLAESMRSSFRKLPLVLSKSMMAEEGKGQVKGVKNS
ncbi:DNA repair related protein [Cyclospora cayetanensis]|uniref:DNA repair related protein n=1 Tax=Cyclospora cayetanensis TaxID=88456 RepID=A0A1D3D4W5_9EIME|nr:DNA repair related protein [Cyclospora cayetanensis]